ncbi:ATP-grasp domain-containing protein [Parasphingorhabdus pacifica]
MKPDVLLASCSLVPESDGDDTPLPSVLGDVGVEAAWVPWDDPHTDFAAADLVVLRSTWDYAGRRAEFLRWCESVPALINPVAVVRWNTDKAYLVELAGRGVPVVPTRLVEPGEVPAWPEAEFVLKPSVGAGSRGAARFGPADLDSARKHLDGLHGDGYRVLLQPYQEAVDREGETALVFLGGVYSHAFGKGPMLTSGTDLDGSGLFVGEKLGAVEAGVEQRRLAEDVLDAACGRLGVTRGELLYARVDLVRGDDGAPKLLELELVEPSLGFRQASPEAMSRFASAVRRTLSTR